MSSILYCIFFIFCFASASPWNRSQTATDDVYDDWRFEWKRIMLVTHSADSPFVEICEKTQLVASELFIHSFEYFGGLRNSLELYPTPRTRKTNFCFVEYEFHRSTFYDEWNWNFNFWSIQNKQKSYIKYKSSRAADTYLDAFQSSDLCIFSEFLISLFCWPKLNTHFGANYYDVLLIESPPSNTTFH